MADYFEIQKEALSELVDYSEKIIKGTTEVIKELREGRKSDTEELLNAVINGINWEIEVFNYCEELINKEVTKIKKQTMSEAVGKLASVLHEKDDNNIALCLESEFVPFLQTLEITALAVVS